MMVHHVGSWKIVRAGRAWVAELSGEAPARVLRFPTLTEAKWFSLFGVPMR